MKKIHFTIMTIVLAMGFSCTTNTDVEESYVPQEKQFMKQARNYERIMKPMLSARYGEKEAEELLLIIDKKAEAFIPEIIFLGTNNKFIENYFAAAFLIPTIRILEEKGMREREIGKLIYDSAAQGYEEMVTPFVKWQFRTFVMGVEDMYRDAAKTQASTWPGDWKAIAVEGDGESFDYGMDFTECGILSLYKAQGLEHYVKYICLCDYAIWSQFDVELIRTQTLGNGAPYCDFRYKEKGSPKEGWPPEDLPEFSTLESLLEEKDKEKKKISCHSCIGCGACTLG
ncbi:MAG: L-2-amino-thiazoline-4-carboxylic acid hydrolase [Spirochaetaceae bacterium]|nr:L-2-amino-thiazoline-4-carboxylic acid hydrolase [Spirochaetaceae bacterium]